MKKMIWTTLAIAAAYLPTNAKTTLPNVLATNTIIADIAQNIGGEWVAVSSLVPTGGDPHTYKPIPQDAVKVVNAALILKNGLTLEGWLDEFIQNSGTKARVVTVTEGIVPLKSLKYKDAADPHAWMVAANGVIYADNVRKAFSELLPEHASDFEANFIRYKGDLEALEMFIQREIQKIPTEKRILITHHDAFQYYGRRYGVRLEAILGTSTDAEIQTTDIQRIQNIIRQYSVPAVFIENTINPKVLQQIAHDNGAVLGGKMFADSLGEKGSGGETYLGMLHTNTQTLVEGLTKKYEKNIQLTSKNTQPVNFWLYSIMIGSILLGLLFFFVKKYNNN